MLTQEKVGPALISAQDFAQHMGCSEIFRLQLLLHFLCTEETLAQLIREFYRLFIWSFRQFLHRLVDVIEEFAHHIFVVEVLINLAPIVQHMIHKHFWSDALIVPLHCIGMRIRNDRF